MRLFNRLGALAGGSESKPVTSGHDASSLIDQGNSFEDQGHLDQALARYEAAIRLTPNLARAHLNRGNVLLEKGDTSLLELMTRLRLTAVDRQSLVLLGDPTVTLPPLG